MTAMPGRTPCFDTSSAARSAYSARSFRATALPSMICAVNVSLRSKRDGLRGLPGARLDSSDVKTFPFSVAVVLRLVRAVLRDADVLRLLVRQLGQLRVQRGQLQQ